MIRTLFILTLMFSFTFAQERVVISGLINAAIPKVGLSYLSRVDTGAKISSLHAINVHIKGEQSFLYYAKRSPHKNSTLIIKNRDYKNNLGRVISFETLNELGEKKQVESKVIKVASVSNAQGKEYRYVILLDVRYKNTTKTIEVNLRDRTKMHYKLLIGRNFLEDDFNVEINSHK